MPWRLTIVGMVLIPVLFWLIFQGLPFLSSKLSYIAFVCVKILLRCECEMTQYIRVKKHYSPPAIIYILSDSLAAIGRAFDNTSKYFSEFASSMKKRWYPPKRLLVIIGIIVPLIWYVRPSIGTNSTSKFLRSGEIWWYSLEGWILSGKWKPSATSYAPEEFIWTYFSTINNHQYLEAWNLTTANFKNNKRLMPNGYADYLSFWKNDVERTNVLQAKLVSKNMTGATIDVNWQYFTKKNRSSPNIEAVRFFLVWDVKTTRWLINNTKKL
ncbi:hypothetical protein [Chamaesiphon sp. VAR_69_metabat_338]|uniref:hypothetical protein n=1 Tax=Chamaesiphon sp. VAR_69_metabat_338 TaxID=2964704 RepID=UPI00286DA17A|nr:hypothetical protein [Chamaesiphon sp. VAR_69_metabat_338]